MEHLGNFELIRLHKTAFLCTRRVPASIVLKCYDWAIEQREEGRCIISGFHSQIEKDVLHYLLKGGQPIIIALARGMKKRFDQQLHREIEKERLLLVTSFGSSVTRVTQETANKRNELMAELTDEIFVSYAQPDANVEKLALRWLKKGKRIGTFDLEENKSLITAGAKAV